ncbi:usherin-like, partial [Acipenser ruthenus]
MVAPNVHVISSRSLRVDWASPGRPNGIMLGYDVRRRTLRWCAQAQLLQEMQTGRQCLYVQCGINENICGGFCYQPEHQICCSGVLYSSKPGYRCCEDKYIPVNGNSTAVCCGGQLYTPQPNYECCGGYYVKVVPGYVCCPNSDQIRVSVGVGNSCCSGNPYSRSGDQICCAGTLHDGFHKQCCGGQVVSKDLICCGNEEKGSVHKKFQ